MRKGWKRWAAILGGAVLLCSQYGTVPVRAEENQGVQAQASAPQAATDLEWTDNGAVTFKNPNTEKVGVFIYLCGPDDMNKKTAFEGPVIEGELKAPLDLYHLIKESGKYKFQVILTANYEPTYSALSEEFTYTKPDKKLPDPVVTVSGGTVSCSLPEGSGYTLGTDYGFNYELWSGSQCIGQRGLDAGTYDFQGKMTTGRLYRVRVCTISRDITKQIDSEWVEIEVDLREDDSDDEPVVWEPTPEELVLYAACGTEEVDFTADAKNTYAVTVENSIQGFRCWDSFDAARGDYTIGRTYSIFPTDTGMVYKMDDKARITLTIPEALQAKNRTFRMIGVTEEGKTFVLQDLDSNSGTITFETDTYYAFALVYRDKAGSRR